MRGYVELSKEGGISLCKQCLKAMKEYPYEYEDIEKSVWFGLKTKKYKLCKNTPHWYGYEKALESKLNSLLDVLDRDDPVHLSLDCYEELIKLSKGDERASAVVILNY